MDESWKKARITTKGVAVVASDTWGRVFGDVMTFMIDIYDWRECLSEELQHSHFELIQQSAVFLLRLLKHHPSGTRGELYARFARAFPDFVKPAEGAPEVERFLRQTFVLLVFNEFLSPLGLVELQYTEDERILDDARYETTELVRKGFRWRR